MTHSSVSQRVGYSFEMCPTPCADQYGRWKAIAMPHIVPRNAITIVSLTRTALAAPNVPAAVTPMLDCLISETAAVGAAYFEAGNGAFFARSAAGIMPTGPAMDMILAHGLPMGMPLLEALPQIAHPLMIDDTAAEYASTGFQDLGVHSLAAAPVLDFAGNLLGAFLMHCFEPHVWTDQEIELFGAVTGTLSAVTARLVAEERAVKAQEGALHALGLALEYRDGETKGHTDRVTALAMRTCDELGMTDEDLVAMRWGAYVHDIGKIGIPDAILHKPGKLDANEWIWMRSHSSLGDEFAQRLPFLPLTTHDVIRHHHERWDGTGYPDKLAGATIPLAARIFSVCDVYDALVSVRPYKAAWTHAEAMREIRTQAGAQFDPMVVDAFSRAIEASCTEDAQVTDTIAVAVTDPSLHLAIG